MSVISSFMTAEALKHLLLLVGEAAFVCAMLLWFFRLRHHFGLALLYMTLGSFQYLQTVLASTLYIELLPGLAVSPGSTVLFTATLFAVLLVYIREDADQARALIVGAVASNITLSAVVFLTSLHLGSPLMVDTGVDSQMLLRLDFRAFMVGTSTFILDVVLIILLYEFFFNLFPRSLYLRISLAMLAVVLLDTLIFVTAVFLESPDLSNILLAGLASKAVAALIYSSILTAYLRLFSSPRKKTDNATHGARDLFALLTYRQRYKLLQDELSRDAMTGLYNRGFFNHNLDREIARAARLNHQLCLIIIDLDHFKSINDTYGHQAGDQVIVTMAKAMQACFRHADICCRFGGEEFVVVMPDASIDAAARVTGRLQESFAQAGRAAVPAMTSAATFTAGIACYPHDATTPETLLRVADKRLYRGKQAGRNRIDFGTSNDAE